jgi:hypothetical protein
MNALSRLLLGSGRFDDLLRAELTSTDLLVLDEGLTGSITYRDYRAPGRYSSWRKEAISGAIALSAQRLVVWAGRGKHIDIPLTGPYRDAVEVSLEPKDRICFTYQAGYFRRDRSGTVQVRLRTRHAARIAEILAASGTGSRP